MYTITPRRKMFAQYATRARRKVMNSARREVEKGISATAARNARWSQVTSRSAVVKVVDLDLLGVPEDPEGQEAQQVSHEPRTEREQCVPQVLLRSDRSRIGYVDLENDESHRDREDTI